MSESLSPRTIVSKGRDKLRFSPQVIKELLRTSAPRLHELKRIYERLPATRCRRQTHCCSMLPEMTLVEALTAIKQLLNMASPTQKKVVQNIIGYFFSNPFEITSCPFLNGRDCLIYEDRFLGCRAYGLWSTEYYQKLSACSRETKKNMQQQWKNLGISLPQAVVDFQVPYCSFVEPVDRSDVNDTMLFKVSDEIKMLSQQYSPWHGSFQKWYFSDLSFLFTALVCGLNAAVKMKFTFVRDFIVTGNETKLNHIIGKLSELFTERF